MSSAAHDSLPYIDAELSYSGMREYVDRLVQEEMARGPSLVPPSAATPSTWVKLEPLDESRFELTAPSGPDAENPDAWLAAVRNAQAQLEHTLVRQVNVDLLAKFGPAAWRRECAYLEAIADSLKKKLASLVEEIEGVNRDRKNEQEGHAGKLTSLSRKWLEVSQKNVQIEVECAKLTAEIARLSQSRLSA